MDLIVYHYGVEECKPSHAYGPALRDHFLLHYIISGSLSILLSELTEQSAPGITNGDGHKENYIKKSIQFIETNYSRSMSIESLASYIGLNKNYFSTIFSELLGVPPQEYLIKYRVNKACKLLNNKDLAISDISRSVGYDDPLGFSKIFKQIKGVSPKYYGKTLL
ncbi:AraC family transcriptional regulator [Clostridium estertheticum]|uniref:AraC family transcriptional regulator n=1 Tax=Clostridium estertheticum TaxID=238834 RepID=UPI001C6F5342|nr:AraC family transcriptional regulator [Clostridium estertheticum]MBW9153743.1 AraC family transcriptional regulator [Clostridium estertheticum]WLC86169.1 AraC family transcriptional regulator [Clostridium estertheticum]